MKHFDAMNGTQLRQSTKRYTTPSGSFKSDDGASGLLCLFGYVLPSCSLAALVYWVLSQALVKLGGLL